MGNFFMCVAQYVIIMIVLAAIGFCGALIGVKLRQRSAYLQEEKESCLVICLKLLFVLALVWGYSRWDLVE